MNDVGPEITRCLFGRLRKRGEKGWQHHAAESSRTSEQTAAIGQLLHHLQAIAESVHLDTGHRVDGRQAGIVRRQHRDVHAGFLFCVR